MAKVKLADFSISTEFEIDGGYLNRQLGTSYYVAPEVFSSRYTEKVDIWSCGVCLYILLCGVPPFNGESEDDIKDDVIRGKLVFKGPTWTERSPRCISFIRELLRNDPRIRPTARQALQNRWLIEKSEEHRERIRQVVADRERAAPKENIFATSRAPGCLRIEGYNAAVRWGCRKR
eukprot:Selendium_serpulae@DN4672_c0_g1_i2.p1